MKAFLSLFATLLLLQSLSSVGASLEETCKKLNGPTVDYNFCVTSPQVDSESKKADTQGLAIIATELAKANFTHNLAKMTELLKSKGLSQGAKQALDVCSRVYDFGIDILEEAIVSIKSRDIPTAESDLSASMTNVETCKDTWEEVGEESLLLKENEDASRISALSLLITTLLK